MAFFSHRQDSEVALTITARTFFKVILLIVVTILLLAALKKASYALTLIIISVFLALALNAPVSWVARHLPGPMRGSRSSAIALSFLIVVLVLGTFIASAIPPIVHQTESFINTVPQLVRDVHDQNGKVGELVTKYHLQSQIDDLSRQLSARLHNSGAGTAVTAVSRIGSSIFATLTILVLTFMTLIEGPRWLEFLRELLPNNRRAHADRLARDMYKAVKGYVNGQVMLAIIASMMLLPGLLIFHVSYPIALLAVVFTCGLIPMVGHTIGAVIVTLVALFHSPFSAVGILVYYILYQQIENYLVQPRLQANTTNLSPLTVLMSVIVGVSFGGLLGGLLAIPVTACLRVWVIDYLQTQHHLGNKVAPSEGDTSD
jgi:predicted PurR-regulated permease PerM